MEEDRARWAELIATSLQVSGLSEEELERKLGWTPGALGRLLDGEGDLEPDQVLEILGELNESSRARKGREAARDGRTQVVTELLERFRRLGYEPRQAAPPSKDRAVRRVEVRRRTVDPPPRQGPTGRPRAVPRERSALYRHPSGPGALSRPRQ